MKKYLALITAAALSATMLAACGKENGGSAQTSEAAVTEQSEPVVDRGEMRGLSAAELIAEMGTGWNLGNSLDSTGDDETSWGNPVTTKKMIDTVRAQGFDILRVPVTWFMHMGEAPGYEVEEAYMNRVQEVVDYGIANDMFVILDIHHETDDWLLPASENMAEIEPKFTELWKQIAEHFKDYGDHLVFEGLNEARVKGTPTEWSGGTEDGRNCVNKLNRIFVDTVRATGGNNSERLLLIAPYAHSSIAVAMSALELDYDKFTGAAVHAYTPYSFTYHSLESYETYKWDGHENSSIDGVFREIDECLISKGMPVIITEYGAVKKDLDDGSLNTEEVCKWAEYYLGKAKELGIPCVWWDNNYYFSGNEYFGLLNRNLCAWYSPDVANTITALYKDKDEESDE